MDNLVPLVGTVVAKISKTWPETLKIVANHAILNIIQEILNNMGHYSYSRLNMNNKVNPSTWTGWQPPSPRTRVNAYS